jgi:hypothetical protein
MSLCLFFCCLLVATGLIYGYEYECMVGVTTKLAVVRVLWFMMSALPLFHLWLHYAAT